MRYNPNAEILVLDEQGTNLGRMPHRDALNIASSHNLDLISVNKKDGVEVFKIMDHGKWKYDKKKNKQKQKKSALPVKEMNFRVCIDSHDQEIKVNRIKNFLDKGADVKITVTMRGREKANPRLAHDKMDLILAEFGDNVQVQQRRGSPSTVFATIRPVPGNKYKYTEPERELPEKTAKQDGDRPLKSNDDKNDDKLEPAYVHWQTVSRKKVDDENDVIIRANEK